MYFALLAIGRKWVTEKINQARNIPEAWIWSMNRAMKVSGGIFILSIILLNGICHLLEVWLKVSQATAVLFTLAGSLLLTFLLAHFQDRKIVSSKGKLEKIVVESVETSVLKVTENSTPPIAPIAPIGWDRVPRFQGEEKSSNRENKMISMKTEDNTMKTILIIAGLVVGMGLVALAVGDDSAPIRTAEAMGFTQVEVVSSSPFSQLNGCGNSDSISHHIRAVNSQGHKVSLVVR